MKYEWYLFDLDGTLTNPKEGITKCFRYALESLGKESLPLEALEEYIGPPLMVSFRKYFSEEMAVLAVEKYRERYCDIGIHENHVYEGIEEALKTAKTSGKKLALATSKPQALAEEVMRLCGLSQYMDVIVGAANDDQSKTDVIQEVFRQAGLDENKKKSVIMVGDRLYDIQGAINCGIDSLGVRFGFSIGNELEEAGATYVVETTKDLTEFIRQH